MQIDKETADVIIGQLARAMGVLTQGRAFGIRVVATEEACEALMRSDRAEAAAVVANLLVVKEMPE